MNPYIRQAGCLYINKLGEIDLQALKTMIKASLKGKQIGLHRAG